MWYIQMMQYYTITKDCLWSTYNNLGNQFLEKVKDLALKLDEKKKEKENKIRWMFLQLLMGRGFIYLDLEQETKTNRYVSFGYQ